MLMTVTHRQPTIKKKKRAPKKVLKSSSIKDRSKDTEGKKIRETRESVKEKERRGDWEKQESRSENLAAFQTL